MYYIVTIKTEFPSREEAQALAAEEGERLKAMVESGEVIAGYLSTDWSGVWLVVKADSSDAAESTVKQLPMAKWFWFDSVTEVKAIAP